jgi:hypothetical protein
MIEADPALCFSLCGGAGSSSLDFFVEALNINDKIKWVDCF